MGEVSVQSAMSAITTYGLQVVGAVVILIVGRLVSGILSGAARKAMERASVEAALVSFVSSVRRWPILKGSTRSPGQNLEWLSPGPVRS